MTAIAARQMGYRVLVLDPDKDCPAGVVADDVIAARFSDRDAARRLARACDVVTYEFENVDADAVSAAEEVQRVFPSSSVLRTTQHRVREKKAVVGAGAAVVAYEQVVTSADLQRALASIGVPGVLKTATSGYDGKGQVVVRAATSEAEAAFDALRPTTDMLVYEKLVPFITEVSVIYVRDQRGAMACYPPTENIHVKNVLDISIAPARVPRSVAEAAVKAAGSIARGLNVMGLLCVEMFVTADGALLVNELAPRPHNSGHWTIEGALTSQFHQLVRVLCGLPLGSVDATRPAVMANLLGDIWLDTDGSPDFASALAEPGVSLHVYGKAEARPGRKMGHLTAIAADVDTALMLVAGARARLRRPPGA